MPRPWYVNFSLNIIKNENKPFRENDGGYENNGKVQKSSACLIYYYMMRIQNIMCRYGAKQSTHETLHNDALKRNIGCIHGSIGGIQHEKIIRSCFGIEQ